MTVNIISDEESNKLSDSFRTWQYIKTKYNDAIILVRNQNTYYTFEKDAEILCDLLNITVERNEEKTTCNLPLNYTDWLLPKLARGGFRIALCEPLDFKTNW